MPTSPDHRASRILQLADTRDDFDGVHPVELDFFYLVKRGESTLIDVRIAYEVYRTPEDRHVFDALILGRADDGLIADALKVSPTVLVPYRHLFCDATVFPHTPAVYRYIRELPLDLADDVEKEWAGYYEVAARQGPEYLANRFRIGDRGDVEPRKVLRTAVSDMYDRFLAHRGTQIDSAVAREALRWGTAAVDAAVILIDKGDDKKKSAVEDLRVQLETRDHTATPEGAGIKIDDILT
jgi:hypothetical protein